MLEKLLKTELMSFGYRNFEGSKKKNLQVIAKYTVGDARRFWRF